VPDQAAEPALERALLHADVATLSMLFEADPGAATTAVDGLPPLLVLLRRSTGTRADVRICARLLLDAGADPDSHTIEWSGEGQMSALFAAVECADTALVDCCSSVARRETTTRSTTPASSRTRPSSSCSMSPGSSRW